jgi:hypothetical protein
MVVARKFRLWTFILFGIAAVVIGLIAFDYTRRYLSWTNLSKTELVASARWYVRERAPGQKVCLYSVICDNGRARLVLIRDVDTWDIEAARQLAWSRRFSDACPGQTANFALEAAEGGAPPPNGTDRATWSFYLDRFRPWRGHSHSAFSEKPAESCTAAYAIAG